MGISSQNLNTMLKNFSTIQPILTCNTPMDSASSTNENTRDHQNFAKLHFRGATGEFPKHLPLKFLNRLTDFHHLYTDRFISTRGTK
jgi:hypothetical protein